MLGVKLKDVNYIIEISQIKNHAVQNLLTSNGQNPTLHLCL